MEIFIDNNQVLLKSYVDKIIGNLNNLPFQQKESLEQCFVSILNKIDNITIPLSNSLTSNDTTTAASSKAIYELKLLLDALELSFRDNQNNSTTEINNITNIINNIDSEKINVKPINFKSSTDIPSTYPLGITIFYSNETTQWFSTLKISSITNSRLLIETYKADDSYSINQKITIYDTTNNIHAIYQRSSYTDTWGPCIQIATYKEIEDINEEISKKSVDTTYFGNLYSNTTKETDSLSWNGTSAFIQNSNTTTNNLDIDVDNLMFNYYSAMFRLKFSTVSIPANGISLSVYKKTSSTAKSRIATRYISASEIESANSYNNYYIDFKYDGTKAFNNNLVFCIETTTSTTSVKINLDYIQVTPISLAVYS